ncbi:MAG: cadherin repeat domain-containing protein, partial [Acidobacteria bacterium]|nr:cadherin repeat domain-containing protein [Acidobacteriota bacterium]
TDQGLAFRLTAATETSAVSADESFDPARPDPWREDRGPGEYQTAAFTVQFERADTVVPVGLAQQETVFNYFVGQQDRWRSAVPTYAAVGYRGLYDGIDLTVSGDGAFLKYAFDVAPGADWGRIAIHYEGVESLSMNDAGDLVIRTAAGDLVDKAPLAYQEAGGQRIVLSAAYRLLDADTVGFALSGTYDPSKELVIDPALIWAQCLGGAGDDSGMAVAVDSAGNVIVTGHTTSTTWEPGGSRGTNHGNSDVFVAKLTSQGLPIWCTYLGGSGDDVPEDMALDSTDNIVLVGATDSGGWISGPFCNSYSGNTDAFVVKLNPRGQHMWSTYLGGSAYDVAHGVTVNPGGEVVIVGETYSSGWVSGGFIPFFAPSYRGRTGFVAGFGADGNNPCSTYTGGADVWRLDCAYDVEFCYAGNGIYIVVGEADLDGPVACVGLFYFAGYGFDVNYPLGWHNASLRSVATAPYWGYRGFYTAGIDQQGQVFVVYSEPWSYGQSYPPLYLAVQGEWPSRIDLAWASSSGNLCLTYTSAEAQLGLQTIVWGLGTDGPAIWCTHRTDLGGKGDEYAGGVAVGRDGTIYVTGGTSSGDWPLGDSGIVYRGGASDAFLAKIGQGVSSGTTTIPGALATVWDYDGKDFKHSAWSLNNGGGVILGGTYWGLGASRPTYRFALPKPSITPGVRELSSITVTIYGKGKGGVFNDTADVWFDNQPLPKRTLRVDEFPNTYTFSGDEARSLLQDAGDGCTSYLDVTIDAVDIMHWYDLRDITVTYTYDGLDSEQLARLDQVVRGRAAILQFKDFHDRFWAGHCVFSAVAKGIAAEGINIVLSLVTGSIPGTWGPLIGALIDHAYGKYVAPHLPDVFYYDLLTGPLDTAIFFVSGGSGYKEGYVSSALETAADRLKDLGNLYISSLSDGILSDNAAELNGAISNAVDAVKRIWKNGDLLGAMNIDYGNNPNETAGEIVKAYVCALSPLLAYNFVLGGGDSGSLVEDNSYLVEYASVLAGQIFNLPPTGVFLSKSSVPEHQPPGTIVGTLSTADPNNGDIDFTYELAGGGADNGKFTISGNTLKTAAEFNYEAKNSYSITAWSTDQGGLSTERPFTVTVTNVNEQPTDINLSGTVVPENQPPGTVVGTLNTVDPDAGDAWTYRLVPDPSGDDNAKFTISGNVLKTAMPFDYETKNLYKIRVESTDLGGLPTEKV